MVLTAWETTSRAAFCPKRWGEAHERGISGVSFTPSDVDGWNLSDIEVATEYQTSDGRIDILLVSESNDLICPIENKIESDESLGQLSRYLGTVEHEYKGLTPFPIFLTPDGRKPEDETDAARWIPFDYEKVADLISQVLETYRSTISASVAGFLRQYERTLRRRVLDTPSDIDRLALQIYNNHPDAIDLIISAKSLPDDIISNAIQSEKSKYSQSGLIPEHSNKTTIRFFPQTLEGIPALQMGESFPSSKRLGLFEILIRADHVTLVFMIGKGPQKIRERFYEFAKNSEVSLSVGRMRKRMDGKMRQRMERGSHFSIYRKLILDKQDLGVLFNPDKARPKIEKAIADFFQHDYWPLVNAIREEFGLSPTSLS